MPSLSINSAELAVTRRPSSSQTELAPKRIGTATSSRIGRPEIGSGRRRPPPPRGPGPQTQPPRAGREELARLLEVATVGQHTLQALLHDGEVCLDDADA